MMCGCTYHTYPLFPSFLYLSCSSALVPITVSFLFPAGGGTAGGGDEAVVSFLFFFSYVLLQIRVWIAWRGWAEHTDRRDGLCFLRGM